MMEDYNSIIPEVEPGSTETDDDYSFGLGTEFYDQMSDTSRLGLDYGESGTESQQAMADGGEIDYTLEEASEVAMVPYLEE